MAAKVCEKHEDALIYHFHATTNIDGTNRQEDFEFCRYCSGDLLVTCPNEKCGTQIRVIDIKSNTVVSASVSTAFLSCNRCGASIASAGV
jgi:hypothetical protein